MISSATPDLLDYRRSIRPAAGFIALIAALFGAAAFFGVTDKLRGHFPSAIISLAIALAPYWAFGFGFDRILAAKLRSRRERILAPAALIVSYLVFSIPRGEFRADLCAGMLAVLILVPLLLGTGSATSANAPAWRDWATLAVLGIAVDLHVFDKAFPVAGLSGIPKLLFVDAGLYGFLVIRPIGGIGFDLLPRLADFRNGLREFLFFTPVALVFGLATHFLHAHAILASPLWFGAAWLFTLLFVAIPEELFFRGLVLNLLERRVGTRRAVIVSSLLFGLAHFNKRAAYFNWRYVILAAVAGYFYARAWLGERRLLTSSVTHATVDTVWSIWLR